MRLNNWLKYLPNCSSRLSRVEIFRRIYKTVSCHSFIEKRMMSVACFYLPILLVALCVTQLQSAPLDVAVIGIDRIVLPRGLPGFRYALVDRDELQQLQNQLDEAEVKVVLMELLQFNMMKIMLLLDIVILVCLYFYVKESRVEKCWCEFQSNTIVKL
ncbi:hypothetical protein KR044_006464 [Drosophila immigrans]|nr:hypothetical protein KR044_006464 [Drosophila immigrans]